MMEFHKNDNGIVKHLVIGSTILMLALAIALFYVALHLSPFFEIKNVEIKGLEETNETINSLLADSFKGENIFAFNTRKAAQLFSRLPFIKEARVYKALPDKIVIFITQRRPVAVIKLDKTYFVGDDATTFRARSHCTPEAPFLPVIEGFEKSAITRKDLATADLLAKIVDALQLIEREGLAEKHRITHIRLDPLDGLVFRFDNGWPVVVLGRSDLYRKLLKMKKILDFVQNSDPGLKVAKIDLNYSNKAILKCQYPESKAF